MIGYLSEFGLGKLSYLTWMKFAYPLLLIEVPIATFILWFTFKPSQKIMDSAVRKLKVQVAKSDDLNGQQKLAIGVFVFVWWCVGWFCCLGGVSGFCSCVACVAWVASVACHS